MDLSQLDTTVIDLVPPHLSKSMPLSRRKHPLSHDGDDGSYSVSSLSPLVHRTWVEAPGPWPWPLDLKKGHLPRKIVRAAQDELGRIDQSMRIKLVPAPRGSELWHLETFQGP